MSSYQSLLETTNNTRDLGGYPCAGGAVTRRMSILRSDLPQNPSERDLRFLKEHNITTIIDIRESAHMEEVKSGMIGQEGFSYCPCAIEEAIGLPKNLEMMPGMYFDIAHHPGALRAFETIADAPGGCMINCWFGKDRTSVIAAILLKLAGVSDDLIVEDYLLTRKYSAEFFEKTRKQYPTIDMEHQFLPNILNMQGFIRLMEDAYPSAEAYLQHIGLSEQRIEAIRRKLVD